MTEEADNGSKEGTDVADKTGAEATKTDENTDVLAELEALKQKLSERDKKISEYSMEKKRLEEDRKAKEMDNKTASEKLAIYEQELKDFKARQTYEKVLKEKGVDIDVDNFLEALNSSDVSSQAQTIADLMKDYGSKVSSKELEAFKLDKLAQVDKKVPAGDKADNEDAFSKGLTKGIKY